MRSLRLSLLLSIVPLGVAWGAGEEFTGKWEMVDEEAEEVIVIEFRENGIMVENDFYEDELVCIYVFPYSVEGNEITVGKGLSWEVNSATGEFELTEEEEGSFCSAPEEITFIFDVSGDELKLAIFNEHVFGILVEFAGEMQLDPEEDLGLDIDLEDEDLEVSDADLKALVKVAALEDIIPAIAEEFGLEEAVVEGLVNLDGLDEIASLNELDEIVEAMEEELDVIQESLDNIGEFTFVASDREITVPAGAFVFSSGRTVVEEKGWGQIKKSMYGR